MPKADILYYPSIEFQNEGWVKQTLLYWDRILRMVPEGYLPQDSDFIRELKDSDLIVDVRVNESQKIETALEFAKLLKQRPAGLVFDVTSPNPEDNARIHKDKINAKLWDLFKRTGITEIGEEWLYMPQEAAGYYMMTLANQIARSRRVPTGTDQLHCWTVNPYFSERGNFDEFLYNKDAKGLYCHLILKDIFPKECVNLTAKDIVGFCNNRSDQKAQLREKVDVLIGRLQVVTDRNQIEMECNDLIDEIEKAKEEYRKCEKFMHSGMIGNALGTGLPISMTALSSTGTPYNPITLGASLILGGVAAIANYSQIKKQRNKSYLSYLVGIDSLAHQRIHNEAYNDMDEFIND